MFPSRESQEQLLERPLARLGMFVIMLPNIFCTMELVPGWGFGLSLSHELLFTIAIGSGVVGGAMIGGRYFFGGAVGGGLAGLGALLAQTTYLAMVDSTLDLVLVVLMLIGALPGALVGYGLARLQIRFASQRLSDASGQVSDEHSNPYRHP